MFGVLALALVALFGWYQFSKRAGKPIDLVRQHAIPGTDVTIGEGILDYIKGRGVKVVTEGFKPSWGAEEEPGGAWVVSYVYEVGRQSHWVSWRVYPASGRVVPVDRMARSLWGSDS